MLVVAAGAFALLGSVVGAWALPGAAGVLLLAVVEGDAALWSVELVAAGAEAVESPEAGAAALEAD